MTSRQLVATLLRVAHWPWPLRPGLRYCDQTVFVPASTTGSDGAAGVWTGSPAPPARDRGRAVPPRRAAGEEAGLGFGARFLARPHQRTASPRGGPVRTERSERTPLPLSGSETFGGSASLRRLSSADPAAGKGCGQRARTSRPPWATGAGVKRCRGGSCLQGSRTRTGGIQTRTRRTAELVLARETEKSTGWHTPKRRRKGPARSAQDPDATGTRRDTAPPCRARVACYGPSSLMCSQVQ